MGINKKHPDLIKNGSSVVAHGDGSILAVHPDGTLNVNAYDHESYRTLNRATMQEERLAARIQQARRFIDEAEKVLAQYKAMKYNIGDLIIHKDYGKGIIVDKFHASLKEDFDVVRQPEFTGYKIIAVRIKGEIAECAAQEVREEDLVPYSENAEVLFGEKS